jgi:uncharacterized protein
MISQEKIQEATKRLVEAYNPVAIYLFGSYAWGEPNEDSDLDFMVIVSDNVHPDFAYLRQKRRKIDEEFYKNENLNFPIDILVNTESKFFKTSNHPSTLQFKILNEGKKSYGIIQKMVA